LIASVEGISLLQGVPHQCGPLKGTAAGSNITMEKRLYPERLSMYNIETSMDS
jgi:hypothetical protein